MNQELANKVGDALIEVGKKFKAGTSDITEDEAIDIFSIVAHQRMSREQVCDEMNINDTKFYNYLTLGKIPKGRKQRGFKELYWWKDEIHAAIKKLRKKDYYVIEKDLYNINCKDYQIDSIYYNMVNKKAKAVTISSIDFKTSIVLFNYHKSYLDYINSIVHEAEHIKQAMLDTYNVEDFGEAPAYTIGYVASQMLKFLL